MPGEDQERFEDYLELERFIAELQAGHPAYPPEGLTPTQARVYRMAMLFHAATPGMSEPDAEFAIQLTERLTQELQMPQEDTAPIEVQTVKRSPVPLKRRRFVSRRFLLAGTVTAAASVALGAGVEHMAEMAVLNKTGPEVTVKVNSPTDWFPVTTVAELGNQAIKFKTENQSGALSLTGYVVRCEVTPSDLTGSDPVIKKGQIIAFSAACTHKGCIVDWSSSDRKFLCPCHGGIFAEDGGIDEQSSPLYLQRLPLLDIKIDDNQQIYVRMPMSN